MRRPGRWNTLMRTRRNRGLAGCLRTLWQRLRGRTCIDISDAATDWLGRVNAGMLHRGNLYCFDLALRQLPPNTAMIEIGSFCGLSANTLAYYRGRYGVKTPFFTCDPWQFDGSDDIGLFGPGSPLPAEARHTFVREACIRNLTTFAPQDRPHTIEMDSDAFFAAWRDGRNMIDVFGRSVTLGGPVGFAYVDGSHRPDQVRRDFANCDAHLVPGGFLLFDDSDDGSPFAVKDVIGEICRSDRYTCVIANPNYLFRKTAEAPTPAPGA